MERKDFVEFAKKESFDGMVEKWGFHYRSGDLTEQGIRKYKLMVAISQWKADGFSKQWWDYVKAIYDGCVYFNDSFVGFFDIK